MKKKRLDDSGQRPIYLNPWRTKVAAAGMDRPVCTRCLSVRRDFTFPGGEPDRPAEGSRRIAYTGTKEFPQCGRQNDADRYSEPP